MTGGQPACVLVRVHDRMEDLAVCLDVIRKHWKGGPYHVVVVSNGLARGIPVPDRVRGLAHRIVELDENAGHLDGSAQLLQAGMAAVPDDCPWTVLLEADTWIFDDRVLRRYIGRLSREGRVWASAHWVEKYHTLGLDVAVVETGFARRHPQLFQVAVPPGPEAWVHEYLARAGASPLHIEEHMPVHIPKTARWLYRRRHGGRYRTFVRGAMVTHHVEDLPGGMEEKKRIANRVLGRREFDVGGDENWAAARRLLLLQERARRWIPRRAWLRGPRWRTPGMGSDLPGGIGGA